MVHDLGRGRDQDPQDLLQGIRGRQEAGSGNRIGIRVREKMGISIWYRDW
jgi:hypothetical protein